MLSCVYNMKSDSYTYIAQTESSAIVYKTWPNNPW